MENQYPFPHRLVIKRRIISPNFEIGKGAIVHLNYASKSLLRLLRAVYYKDKLALELSPASENFLLNNKGGRFTNEYVPCFSLPKIFDFNPKIVTPSANAEQ